MVLRVGEGVDQRFLVVDYKTNRLGEVDEPLTALDYTQELMTAAMLHSNYPLQALLYSVVLHRYLRWRLPGYDPERHLGGILYLYVRGMCGPETPEVDGIPCGVFSWHPPAAMVVELSDLLDGRAHQREEGVMTVTGEPVWVDAHDRRRALAAPGLLARFNLPELLHAADVHVALRLGDLLEETDEEVLLATALAVRAVRTGSVCLDLATIADVPLEAEVDLPWPEPAALGRARGSQPAGARGDGAPGRQPALPRPLLARGGPGLRRPGHPHPPYAARGGRRGPRHRARPGLPG